jgi:hypothetical protein
MPSARARVTRSVVKIIFYEFINKDSLGGWKNLCFPHIAPPHFPSQIIKVEP